MLFSSTNIHCLPALCRHFFCLVLNFLKLNICYPMASFYIENNLNSTPHGNIKMSSMRSQFLFNFQLKWTYFHPSSIYQVATFYPIYYSCCRTPLDVYSLIPSWVSLSISDDFVLFTWLLTLQTTFWLYFSLSSLWIIFSPSLKLEL